jgi:hypothetical protein
MARSTSRSDSVSVRTLAAWAVLVVCLALAVAIPMHTCPPGWSLDTSWWYGHSWASCGRRFPGQDMGIPAVSRLVLKLTIAAIGSLLAVVIGSRRRSRPAVP